MDYIFREAIKSDKAFLLNANKEINGLSGLDDSTFEKNIDKDLFEDRICKSLIVEENGVILGFLLYSYVYWANCGKGIYLSNAYVNKKYRNKGLFKMLLSELEKKEISSNFITNLVGNENSIMMKSLNKLGYRNSDLITYYKMIENAKAENRKGLVLTCKDHLVKYYSKFGFIDEGISESNHGGVTWHEMRLRF